MKTILYISPDLSVKGGISTVVKSYLSSDLSQKYRFSHVSSHVDGSKVRKLIKALEGLIRAFLILLTKKVDLVHVHGSDIVSSNRKYFYIRLAGLFGVKIIYHFHGALFIDHYVQAAKHTKMRMKRLFEFADTVICLSDGWRNSIIDIAPAAKIKMMPNAVKLPELQPVRAAEKPVRLAFLGLVGERKGVFDLVRVVRRLINDGHDIRLNIAGNGDIDRLNEMISGLQLSEKVSYLGWISEIQRDRLLRRTDIYVLPSYGEGMPMSVLEAMSYSIPVVSTNVGGIPELVLEGETGYLVEPGDIEALYHSLTMLIADEGLRTRLGAKGRQIVAEKHDLNTIVRKLDGIYGELL